MNYFDLHCDTITECYNQGVSIWENHLNLCVDKGSEIDQWVQVYAVWIDDALTDLEAYKYFIHVQAYLKEQLKLRGQMVLCQNAIEIEEALRLGKRVAILAIEGSRALDRKVENVQVFYDLGVRMMTLTWNGKAPVGDGCMVEAASGLTDFGKRVVSEMNRVGMIVDVSHLSEKGFWDVVALSNQPFIATHSNSKSICNQPRNLTDEQFGVIVERQGIVGMNFYPLFINGTYEACIEELFGHIDHFMSLGGAEVIAMGSDFDGAKMPRDMRGIMDIPYLYQMLQRRYGENQADQFYFGNAMSFLRRNL